MKHSLSIYRNGKGWDQDLCKTMDSSSSMVLILAAPSYFNSPAIINEIISSYPNSHIIGCSTAGEINKSELLEGSIICTLLQFNKTKLKSISLPISSSENSFESGKKLAETLLADDLKAIFILSEGLIINGSTLLDGVNSILPKHIVVTGGLAGDGNNFKQTWTIHNKSVKTNQIVAIGFYGENFNIFHGSYGGWDIFGPERLVTKSKGNILYEFDNQPALQLYKMYLGQKSNELPASGLLFPLQIRKDLDDHQPLVRTILGIDEKSQSLIFAGDIPEGYLAQLMSANFERLIDGAGKASSLLNLENITAPLYCCAISCVGRRLALGERVEDELEAAFNVLPKHALMTGFYAYGEISPTVKGEACSFHNQTMTITAFSEKE
ncbi:MAG: FIST N-terminal domain-containing protein [Bacteriovorax sp.]|nr:FIST N-terminal domain-containing protein [Bacteriovorax sp.]